MAREMAIRGFMGRSVRVAAGGLLFWKRVAEHTRAAWQILANPPGNVKTAARPDGLCVDPGGRNFAVASNHEGRVEVFSTEAWKSSLQLNLDPGLGACLWLAGR